MGCIIMILHLTELKRVQVAEVEKVPMKETTQLNQQQKQKQKERDEDKGE